jgi:chromate transporter
MMDRVDLSALFLHSLALWFVAVGGPSAILPDFHRYIVEAHQLMTSAEFAELYTLAQAAPGPNFMYVTLIGWRLAGWSGAVTMTIPVLVPAATLSLLVGHMNERYVNAPIRRAIQRSLAPITIGLMCASATVLMRAVNHDWRGYLLTLVTVVLVLRTPCSPLWLLAAGALAGVLGLV